MCSGLGTGCNITYYQLLSERAVGRLIDKVERGLEFFIKANRDLTHRTGEREGDRRRFHP